MKSSMVRRRHVDLDDALTAMSDPDIPIRDAVVMWRKALRRADAPTRALLSQVSTLQARHRKSLSS
jgi:hypothetical protein